MNVVRISAYFLFICVLNQVHFGQATDGSRWLTLDIDSLKEASSNNDPFAQAYLGLLFAHGDRNVNLSKEEAFKLAELSSESNHWLGHFLMGFLYRTGPIGPDISKVKEFYLKTFQDPNGSLIKLAARKDPVASYALGEIFTSDELRPFVVPDLKLAYRYYEVASEGGFMPAAVQLSLFKMHMLIPFGQNASLEIENGIKILKDTVSMGLPSAHHYLGRAFFEGTGVEKDLEMAFVHFQAAADKGEVESQLILSDFYGQGIIDSPKLDLAIRYANLAIKSDYKRGMEKLTHYENLIKSQSAVPEIYPDLPTPNLTDKEPLSAAPPVPPKQSELNTGFESKRLPSSYSFKSAITDNETIKHSDGASVPSSNELGSNLDIKAEAKAYYFGRSRPQDFIKAYSLFEQSSRNGDPESLRYLGLMHLTGKGVPKDSSKALNFFEDASLAGDTMSKDYLLKLKAFSRN